MALRIGDSARDAGFRRTELVRRLCSIGEVRGRALAPSPSPKPSRSPSVPAESRPVVRQGRPDEASRVFQRVPLDGVFAREARPVPPRDAHWRSACSKTSTWSIMRPQSLSFACAASLLTAPSSPGLIAAPLPRAPPVVSPPPTPAPAPPPSAPPSLEAAFASSRAFFAASCPSLPSASCPCPLACASNRQLPSPGFGSFTFSWPMQTGVSAPDTCQSRASPSSAELSSVADAGIHSSDVTGEWLCASHCTAHGHGRTLLDDGGSPRTRLFIRNSDCPFRSFAECGCAPPELPSRG
mmetsp:Transcript_73101/g.208317  ORF Transcript_73101/g.208317 Transcript_73101/m.208317 type:complete len:296 (-) Transcript_73101:150-1037(-)